MRQSAFDSKRKHFSIEIPNDPGSCCKHPAITNFPIWRVMDSIFK